MTRTTTDGAAAAGRNERGAIGAAEFLARQSSQLARYQEAREDLVRIAGRLREVNTVDDDTVWITVDTIEGRPKDHELATATIKSPAPETDAVLKQIGRNGPITLEGRAKNTPEMIALLHMHEVRRINDYVVVPGQPTSGDSEGEDGDAAPADSAAEARTPAVDREPGG